MSSRLCTEALQGLLQQSALQKVTSARLGVTRFGFVYCHVQHLNNVMAFTYFGL